MTIENFRSFSQQSNLDLGAMTVLVGQNDCGKSNVLRALQCFLDDKVSLHEDIHCNAGDEEAIVIQVSWGNLPDTIEFEERVSTTFSSENLLDSDGNLSVRKTYPKAGSKGNAIEVIATDFEDEDFRGLSFKMEPDLNKLCKKYSIEISASGRGVTNKSKRDALRDHAREAGLTTQEAPVPVADKSDAWKAIRVLFPTLEIFESDTKLGVGETTFQSQFKAIIKNAAEDSEVGRASSELQGAVAAALQSEIDDIYEKLSSHTDAFKALEANPSFIWEKAVTFDILGKDQHDVSVTLENRGSGLRRLLMVAFFQYLVDRKSKGNTIYAIEEPENCLHPRLQRALRQSFLELAEKGVQFLLTTHSPVFAGAVEFGTLGLVVRQQGSATIRQAPNLDPFDVADELGIEPSDQLTGYDGCVFVEGVTDEEFWTTIVKKLKEGGHLDADLEERRIGFVSIGGCGSLKHLINARSLRRINRRYAIIVDSDREAAEHNIKQSLLNSQAACEDEGAQMWILRKREMENYIHRDAIDRSDRQLQPFDDYSDMKQLFGKNVYKISADMTAEEILNVGEYEDDNGEHKELLDIAEGLIGLGGQE